MVQQANSSGAGDEVLEADVYIKYRRSDGSTYARHYYEKVTRPINVVWYGDTAGRAEGGFMRARSGGVDEALRAAFMSTEFFSYPGDDPSGLSQQKQDPKKPQTPLSPQDISFIYKSLNAIGKHFPACSNFIKGTLEKLKELNPNNPPVNTDIVKIFEAIQKQPNGGSLLATEATAPWMA